MDRLTEERWIDPITLAVVYTDTLGWNADGTMSSNVDNFSGYSYGYDGLGRLASTANSGTPGAPAVVLSTGSAGYDANGNRTALNATVNGAADFANTYEYDTRNRETKVTQAQQSGGNSVATKRVQFQYDAAGQMIWLSRYSNLTGFTINSTSYEYDFDGRVTKIQNLNVPNVGILTWGYDKANRLISSTDASHADLNATYTYDDAAQLTGATRTAKNESYTYDGNGNRTNGGNVTESGSDNRQSSDGTYRYEYDPEGNLVLRWQPMSPMNARTFQYDHRNRLVEVKDYTGYVGPANMGVLLQEVDYTYDANNLRIEKVVDPDAIGPQPTAVTRFVYDGQHIVLDFVDPDGAGPAPLALSNRYLWGPAVDQILAREDAAGTTLWTLTDNLGSVRYLFNNSHMVVDHISYDSFGNVLTETVPATNFLFRYTGAVFDVETGLQYNRARYYDPTIGRWISQDPIGFDGDPSNLYRYVGNSPTNATDPFGEDFIAVDDRRVGGTVGAYHYSLEYWRDNQAAPAGQFSPSSLNTGNPNCGGSQASRLDQVELLASTGWTSWFRYSGTPPRGQAQTVRMSVSVAYISRTSNATTLLVLRDNATRADWNNVIAYANAYGYAEHPAGGGAPVAPLRNWPFSNYVATGTNSNTFVRWVVGAAGMTMTEMSGGLFGHPGNDQPSLNGSSVGVFLNNPPPFRR